MLNKEIFRKVKHYTTEIDPTTSLTLLLSSTMIGLISGQPLGRNFEATIWASSAAIHIGFSTSVTYANGFEISAGQSIDIMVENGIYGVISNAATGKFKAIVWD